MRRPDSLTEEEQLTFKQVRARSPHLDAAARLVTEFADMITELRGDRLDTWIAAVEKPTCRTCIRKRILLAA